MHLRILTLNRQKEYLQITIVSFKDLDFIDDVVILSESLETLVVALDALSNEKKPLGLQVSWTNTKIHDFGCLLFDRYVLAVRLLKSQGALHNLVM